MICLYCLHDSVASRANLDLGPAQPQHPLSKLTCQQSQMRLYGQAQLQG